MCVLMYLLDMCWVCYWCVLGGYMCGYLCILGMCAVGVSVGRVCTKCMYVLAHVCVEGVCWECELGMCVECVLLGVCMCRVCVLRVCWACWLHVCWACGAHGPVLGWVWQERTCPGRRPLPRGGGSVGESSAVTAQQVAAVNSGSPGGNRGRRNLGKEPSSDVGTN